MVCVRVVNERAGLVRLNICNNENASFYLYPPPRTSDLGSHPTERGLQPFHILNTASARMLRFSYKYGVRYVYAEREQCRIGCVVLTFTRVVPDSLNLTWRG